MTLIFPHIPKCGGTSIKRLIEQSRKVAFFDYDHPPAPEPFYAAVCAARDRDFARLDFSPFDIVFGHFPIRRYASTRYEYACLLRDPVDRAVSQFNYWKYALRNPVGIARSPIIEEVRRGSIGVVDFAERMRFATLYRDYLGYRTEGFALVGFVDRMEDFAGRFSGLLGIPVDTIFTERKNEKKDVLAPEEHSSLQSLLREDIGYYQTMRRLFPQGHARL